MKFLEKKMPAGVGVALLFGGWLAISGSAVIVGGVVDAKTNRNLTLQAMSDYILPKKTADTTTVPSPSAGLTDTAMTSDKASGNAAPSDGEQLLRQFLTAAQNGVLAQVPQEGLSGPHVLYAFVDPNCIFCHKLFDYVQAHKAQLNAAGVRVVYVPVAILKESSFVKAAEVAKGGWSALLEDESGFNDDTEEGGLPATASPDGSLSSYVDAVHANTQWLSRLASANGSGVGTPFMVWQAGDGRAYYMDGFPTEKGFDMLLDSFKSGWTPPASAK